MIRALIFIVVALSATVADAQLIFGHKIVQVIEDRDERLDDFDFQFVEKRNWAKVTYLWKCRKTGIQLAVAPMDDVTIALPVERDPAADEKFLRLFEILADWATVDERNFLQFKKEFPSYVKRMETDPFFKGREFSVENMPDFRMSSAYKMGLSIRF